MRRRSIPHGEARRSSRICMKLQAAPSASRSETYLWAIAGHSLTLMRAREAFTCWKGRLNSSSGEKVEKGGRGFWALAPRGVSHTFGNAGDSPARLLIIHSPAADAYFAELEALWKDSIPTPEEERDLMKRHGLEPIET